MYFASCVRVMSGEIHSSVVMTNAPNSRSLLSTDSLWLSPKELFDSLKYFKILSIRRSHLN